jgi:eukaryotic-like serine/threonine-protein kinase
MRCAACGADTASSTTICDACAGRAHGTGEWGAQHTNADGATVLPGTPSSRRRAAEDIHASHGPLIPGQAFGRYQIIRLLGAGGMGAVYQAWDDELAVSVAVKVIRPQVEEDPAGARDLERRFKRELLLARQVTHKNVVRIHDLGEIDGIKYITMPYLQGRDLASVLRSEGRLPLPRVLSIARDVVAGLQAAHEAGVVHRDLKPANVMLDEDGRAIIMDFGIARSTSGGAATMAGAVVGTLEYMAPEQALGHVVDHRADIYAFGLILHDLLTGPRKASRAESAVAELLHRIQQPLPPLRTLDASVPEGVEALVACCTAPDPAARFSTTAELASAIEALTGPSGTGTGRALTLPAASPTASRPARAGGTQRWTLAAVAAAVVGVLGVGAAVWLPSALPRDERAATAGSPRTSLAIVPFRNTGGDPSLDWLGPSIAELLGGEIREAGRVRVVPGNRVHEVLRDLRVDLGSAWTSETADRVASFGNADVLVTGEYARFGTQLRIQATVRNVQRQSTEQVTVTAAGDEAMLGAIGNLAGSLHGLVGGDHAVAAAPAALRPSSTSVPALRAFTEGVEAARRGDHQEALQRFQLATKEDPGFALAWARLAQAHADLGYDAQAEDASRRAVSLAEALPDREKRLVTAVHARILNDHEKAIAAYEHLLAHGADDEVAFALAGRYEAVGAFDKAREHYGRVVAADPNHLDALFSLGRVDILRKSPQTALDALNRGLSIAIRIDNQQAKGALLNAIGVAYKRLDKPGEALRYYREALAIREVLEDKRGMAATSSELAQVEARLGRTEDALAHYGRSLALRQEIGDRRGVGNTLNDIGSLHESRGQLDEALRFYTESLQVQQEVGNEDYQALCLHNIANVLAARTRYEDAVSYYTRALQLREKLEMPTEVAAIRYHLGSIRLRQGDYEEALRQFLAANALARASGDPRGEAIATAGSSLVFASQGRHGPAVDASGEALARWRTMAEPGSWQVTMLAVHGYALGLAGRADDARTTLAEALAAARETGDARLLAEVLVAQAATLLVSGEHGPAGAAAAEGLRHATAVKDEHLVLSARLAAAQASLAAGRASGAVGTITATRDSAAQARVDPARRHGPPAARRGTARLSGAGPRQVGVRSGAPARRADGCTRARGTRAPRVGAVGRGTRPSR